LSIAHEDGRPAAPDSGFDEIAGDLLDDHPLDAMLDVVEARHRQHRDGGSPDVVLDEIHHVTILVRLVGIGFLLEQGIGQGPLQEIEIQPCCRVAECGMLVHGVSGGITTLELDQGFAMGRLPVAQGVLRER
jgi:hypothetical protein